MRHAGTISIGRVFGLTKEDKYSEMIRISVMNKERTAGVEITLTAEQLGKAITGLSTDCEYEMQAGKKEIQTTDTPPHAPLHAQPTNLPAAIERSNHGEPQL